MANALGMSRPGDRHPCLGHVRGRAQPVDDAVQLRRLLGDDDAGAHGIQGDPVGEPELRPQQRTYDCHDRDHRLDEHDQRRDEDHIDKAEQKHGQGHPSRELMVRPPIGRSPSPAMDFEWDSAHDHDVVAPAGHPGTDAAVV
ncbi:hypothetical protein [Nocardia asiatica]